MTKKAENNNDSGHSAIRQKLRRRIAAKPPMKNHYIGRTIAVTVTSDTVVLATHLRGLFRSRLIDATRIPFPADISDEDTRQAFLNNTIGDYLKKYRKPLTKIIMGTGSVDSAFRVINLPDIPRKELAGAIFWEADKQIPFKLDRSYYGYRILPRNDDSIEDDRRLSVAVTAFQKLGIDENLKYLRTAGMNITAVYSELEAVGFMLYGLKKFRKDEVYVLIRAGSSKTEIGFYLGHRLTFVHTIALGAPPQDKADMGEPAIERYYDTLLAELQNSLDYYAGLHPNASPRTIYLYGEVICRANILTDLSTRSGGLEFQNIAGDLNIGTKVKPGADTENILRNMGTIALALADYRLLNFIPPELKEMQAERKFYRLSVPVMALLVFSLLGLWMSMKATANIEQSRLNGIESEIANFKNSASYAVYHQIKKQIAGDREMLKLLENNPTFLHLNLKELTHLTPWKIKLLQFELNDENGLPQLTLTGQVFSNDPPPEVLLAEYIAGLEKSPFYDLVTLKRHSKKYEKGRFIVDFQIDMRAII
jgi:hypothetical protein